LVTNDGRMNAANERPSVEADEETFIDRHGRSLHLVGADVRLEQERPTLRGVMALLGLLNPRSPCVPSGLDLFKSTALGAAQILKGVIVIASRSSPAICESSARMPFEALRMIETKGLIAAVDAADAMVKTGPTSCWSARNTSAPAS
jgi:hypothetical protein